MAIPAFVQLNINTSAGKKIATFETLDTGGNTVEIEAVVITDSLGNEIDPLTNAQLRAAPVPVTTTQLPAALVGGRLDVNLGSWLGSTTPTVGQKTMASSIPVVIASDQSSLPVTVGNFPATQAVNLTQVAGAAVTTQAAGEQLVATEGRAANGGAATGNPVLVAGSDGANARTIRTAADGTVRIDPTGTTTQPVSTTQLPAALVGGRLDVNLGTWLGSAAPTVGQKTMANSLPVVLASDQTVIAISGTVTANQGTPAAIGNAWPIKVTDGVNAAAVKAANTAAVAADPAEVVALSPNTPLPAGTNVIGALSANQSVNVAQVGGVAVTTLGAGEQKVAVEGLAANGAAVSGNPVLVAGSDGANARTIKTDATGIVQDNLAQWIGSTAPTVGQKAMASSIPVVIASDQTAVATQPQVVGAHGNAWNNAAVGVGGNSASIDCQFTPDISAFGHVSAATTITLQVSQDNVNFFNALSTTLAAASDFYIGQSIGARFIRLSSSLAATITATIAGKD